MCSTAQAASLGHSRVVSALGQPLHINVPIIELSADDLRTLAVSPAPAPAWAQAGLTPPVDLNTLQLRLADGYAPGTKVVELRSSQPFDKAVADVLLDVRTASGQQRYQVSLLTQGGTGMAAAQRSAELRGAGSAASASALAAQRAISVKRGDTMFAIARRHAVQGVTVYQMMIALQKANPQAFIHENINLVKAGATLQMPDMAALTAISDREARRLFMKQAHEFALYRQRAAGGAATVSQDAAASGVVSTQGAATAQEPAGTPRDQLRLSGAASNAGSASGRQTAGTDTTAAGGQQGATGAGGAQGADVQADDSVAARKNLQEAQDRVSTLEDNVKHLNQALQAQGAAASGLVVEGAKSLTQTFSDDKAASNGQQAAGGAASQSADGAGSPGAGSANGTAAGTVAGPAGATGTAAGSATGQSTADASLGNAGASATAGNGQAANNAATAGSTGGAAATGGAGPGTDAAAAGSNAAAGATGSSDNGGNGGNAAADSGKAAAGASNGAPASGNAATGSSNVAPGSGNAASGAGSVASGSSGAALGSGNAAAGSGNVGPGSGSAPSSSNGAAAGSSGAADSNNATEAGSTVSWLQEHMLGVITGVLAFIVLIIAWLLRRANAARDEGNGGLITEAMVREKLDQINLDFEQQSSDDAARRKE